MRLFRCDTVDGTYTDAAGKDMYLFVEHKDHGLKMMGNYTFPSLTQTYMAPGGQTAFEDEDGKFGSTTSDSIKAMITNDTTHILMNIIAFEEDENLERYIEYSKKLLERFADATIIDTKITKCK